MTTVEHARQVVAELESKLVAASDRATRLAMERRRVAYSASVGDKPAAKELAKLTAESVTIGLETENLTSAIDEARFRLAEAERNAALVAARVNAKQVKEIAASVEKRGPVFAAALSALCEEFAALEADLRAMRELGAEIVPQRLVALSFTDVVSHSCRAAGIDIGDMVPPARRHSPDSLTQSYACRANEWAAAVLGEKEAA